MGVDLRDYYSRRQRHRDTLGTVLRQLVFFLLSLIPAAVTGWIMYEAGLFEPREVTQEQPPPELPGPRPPPDPGPEENEAPDIDGPPRERWGPPRRPPPEKKPPKQKRELRVKLNANSYPEIPEEAQLAAVTVVGAYHIDPPSGELPAKVSITDGTADVTLHVRRDGDSIETEATIKMAGKDVAFRVVRLERMRGSLIRRGQAVTRRLAKLTAEKEQLKTAVLAPVTKPLAWRGWARTRIMLLNKAIEASKKQQEALAAELQRVNKVGQLAESLDDCDLIFRLGDGVRRPPGD